MTKRKIDAFQLIIILSLYFSFVLNIAFEKFIIQHLSFDDLGSVIFALSLPLFIFVPLFLVFNIITVPYLGKIVIILLAICSSISNYIMAVLGIPINWQMVQNFAETNIREATDLITFRAVLIVILSCLPVFILATLKIEYKTIKKELFRRISSCLIAIFVLAVFALGAYKDYISLGRNYKEFRHYINTFNYLYSVPKYYKKHYAKKKDFVFLDKNLVKTKKTDTPRVLVLIVGETARSKNFSLYGYERKTNPLLEKKNIFVLNDVTSCGTATAISLPCLFSHQTRQEFRPADARYTQNLIDFISGAQYDVFWNDNDDGCKGICSRVANTEAVAENISPYCFKNYCQDEVLLSGLKERIDNIQKDSVIVLHMMGSHGPTYYKRYPEKFKQFTPTCDTSDLQDCSQEEIINTYDNTILYTDFIVSSVIDLLQNREDIETGMVYISDHGESLGENNIYLHGLPYTIAPNEQKEIPLILWFSDALKEAISLDEDCFVKEATSLSYSHDNFFHSVLRLLNIDSSIYKKDLDIFARCSH